MSCLLPILHFLIFLQLAEQFTEDEVKEMLAEIIKSSFDQASELEKKTGFLTLERGFATIPLPGIDVPFHSRYLWAGVMPFRACKFVPSSVQALP